MAKPYDLYVRYLVTQGCKDTDEANQRLSRIRLQPTSRAEFAIQHDRVYALPGPVIDQIQSGRHEGDFLKWMKRIEVDTLYKLDAPVLAIHQDSTLRSTINALLIKRVALKDVAQTINLKFSVGLSEAQFALYERSFWDPRRMTREDWRTYLEHAPASEASIIMWALSEPLEMLKSHLELPSKTSVSDMLQYMLSQSYARAKQSLRLSTPDSNKEARAWMNMTMNLATKYEKFRAGDIADFGKELQLEFDYISAEFGTPDQELLKEVERKASGITGEHGS